MKGDREKALGIVDARFVGALGISGGELPPPTFAEVAFAGRSNVGKSSLINTLVERRGLVRTSSTPGMTRQINLFEARARDGAKVVLTDLPGYGYAQRSKQERRAWGTLIEGYLKTRATLGMVTLLIDARRGIGEEEEELMTFARLPRPGLRALEIVVVATKVDKIPASSRRATLLAIERQSRTRVIGFSSVTGEGRIPLWGAIRRALSLDPGAESESAVAAPETPVDEGSPGATKPA